MHPREHMNGFNAHEGSARPAGGTAMAVGANAADTCENGGRMTPKFILRTDKSGKRWEVSLRADGTIVYRLEGDASWLAGWPPSLPSLKDEVMLQKA